MSIQPGQYNITVQRRADFDLQLQFKDSADSPINLTGWTAYAQVWDAARTDKLADFTVTYTNRAQGQIKIALSDTDTADFPNDACYDVMLENASGIRHYYLEGIVYVSEGYTAP